MYKLARLYKLVDSLPTLTHSKMDMTDDNHIEGMEMETENWQTMDNDFTVRLSDETHQHLTFSEVRSSSCKMVKVRSRPRLESTKSFPPYSQCIGGLGEDNELNSESSNVMREDKNDVVQGTERKEDFELNARCARDMVKAKWRMRRKERLGGSYEVDADGWERARWSGKRRVEETARESEPEDEEREGALNSEWKHWRGKHSSFEIERKEEEDEERRTSPFSTAEGESEGSGKTPEGNDEEAEGSTTHQWPSPHPILSKLLHSSTSSCSSINFSSAESDEVFSEGEDVDSKRRSFRKVRIDRLGLKLHFSFLAFAIPVYVLAGIMLVHLAALVFDGRGLLKLYFSAVLCTCGPGDLHGLERGL